MCIVWGEPGEEPPRQREQQVQRPHKCAWCVLGTAGSLQYSILIAASQASSP